MNNTNDKAYTKIRKELIENQKLEAVIFMPSGIFLPYAGVQTGILVFTKTNSGGTNKVWMYNMEADGYSLDQKRNEVPENDIPYIVKRFKNLDEEESRDRTEKSFLVDKQDIVNNDYVLSFNKYQKKVFEKKVYRSTKEIVQSIKDLENQFKCNMDLIEKELNKQ
jgi:type I restriction enzyme M protein